MKRQTTTSKPLTYLLQNRGHYLKVVVAILFFVAVSILLP